MSVTVQEFGTTKCGKSVMLYRLKNAKGMQVDLMNYGANIVRLLVPDAGGEVADVALGFDTLEGYYNNPSFFGAVIGPNANRTDGAAAVIDGVECRFEVNDGPNNLHSHIEEGWHKRFWTAETTESSVTFSLDDEDGHMGFPGNKKATVTYTLSEDNALTLHYHISSDKHTILNPTNHSYFNLDGHQAGNIEDHELTLHCSSYVPVAAGAIPTGEIADVTGTVMDFRAGKRIGQDIGADFEQLHVVGGYDHNWCIDGWDGTLREVAVVKAPKSGRVMKVATTLPGIQFYAGNFITAEPGKDGAAYDKRMGFALESQYYPDTIHHEGFPSYLFGGDLGDYDSVTVYSFS